MCFCFSFTGASLQFQQAMSKASRKSESLRSFFAAREIHAPTLLELV